MTFTKAGSRAVASVNHVNDGNDHTAQHLTAKQAAHSSLVLVPTGRWSWRAARACGASRATQARPSEPITSSQVRCEYRRTPSAWYRRFRHIGGSSTGKVSSRQTSAASMNARVAAHAAYRTCTQDIK